MRELVLITFLACASAAPSILAPFPYTLPIVLNGDLPIAGTLTISPGDIEAVAIDAQVKLADQALYMSDEAKEVAEQTVEKQNQEVRTANDLAKEKEEEALAAAVNEAQMAEARLAGSIASTVAPETETVAQAEVKSDITEVKSEEKAEIKSETTEVNAESKSETTVVKSEEIAQIKSETTEVKSEEKAESKSESTEMKSEEIAQINSEATEVKAEEKAGIMSEVMKVKSEENLEVKAAEAEKPAEVKMPTEVMKEHAGEVKAVNPDLVKLEEALAALKSALAPITIVSGYDYQPYVAPISYSHYPAYRYYPLPTLSYQPTLGIAFVK